MSMKYFSKRLDTVKLFLMRCGIFLQAMNELLAEDLYLWWIVALTNVCEHDETSASETYARHAGRQSTADCHKAAEDDERERTRSGGVASAVSSEKDYNGVRVNKYTARSEMLYFNQFYAMRFDNLVGYGNGQSVKHIYLGDTRIVTKLNTVRSWTWSEEVKKQYFYHSDHLGSASLISDCDGKEYQRIEYTPYGETWVEKTQNTGMEYLPYKFTGKERDEETGLYYYGARYLDAKYSRWLSTDPALEKYIPLAPLDDEAKKHNEKLPGMGGVFNTVNLQVYHYGGNNPIKYVDPDGEAIHILIGAIIGGALAATVSAVTQRVKDGKIDGKKVLLAAGGGALSGALAATGVGLGGQVIANGAISLAQDSVTQFGFEGKNLKDADYLELGLSFLSGCAAGFLGGKGADSSHVMASSTKQLFNRIGNALAHKNGNELMSEVSKAIAYYGKTNGLKSISKDTVTAILKGTIPSAANLGMEIYKKVEKLIKGEE